MEKKAQKTKKTERRGRREKQVVDGETATGKEEVAPEAESVSTASLLSIFIPLKKAAQRIPINPPVSVHSLV